MNTNTITLYPTNWLYNAGVVGLLGLLYKSGDDINKYFSDGCVGDNRLLANVEEIMQNKKCDTFPDPLNTIPLWHWHYVKEGFDWNYGGLKNFIKQNLRKASFGANRSQIKKQLKVENTVKYRQYEMPFTQENKEVDKVYSLAFGRNVKLTLDDAENRIFNQLVSDERKKILFIYRKFVGALFSKTTTGTYQNYFHNSKFDDIGKFIDFFDLSNFLKPNDDSTYCNFCCNNQYVLTPIKTDFMAFLFPNYNEFPNAFWNNDETKVTKICGLCKFILIHHHLAFHHISDGSNIFINAPSFKVMYELNKLVKETYGSTNIEEARGKREILATSVIEYSRKITTTLGLWTEMNIDIVSKYLVKKENNKWDTKIDFFSMPHDVIKIISDRRIAALLSELGEFKILNKVLDQKYSQLIDIGYKLLKTGLKDYKDRSKNEKDLVYDLLYRDSNRRNVLNTANKILKLYALIEDKIKRS